MSPDQPIRIGTEPGLVVEVIPLGAAVHRLLVDGRNVVLGQPSAADRLASSSYLGGTIGRYANRIAHGRFELDGSEVVVGTHDRGHSLHGGPDGFDRRVWDVVAQGPDELVLALVSPHGDQGFPGTLRAQVRYVVSGPVVRIEMSATTDAPTVVNLTNHAYFNLLGEDAGSIDGHTLSVLADAYSPVDDTGIPLGHHEPVDGTPFDLRSPTLVGPVLRRGHPQLLGTRGIDHNFVIGGSGLRPHATLDAGGLHLELRSDQPGLQVYTANALDGTQPRTSGGHYRQGDGLALEPQLFPDSPNRPEWPSPVLRPGETYRATIEWELS